MVRAKFTCTVKEQKVPETPNEEGGFILTFLAVYSGSDENKEFFRLTPAGQIRLETVNPAAAAQFEQGKEYYIDFTPAS